MDPFSRAMTIAARQHGAISSAQAKGCGLTRNQIRQALRSGRWDTACHAVYVTRGAPTSWEQRAWVKVLAAGANAVLSQRAAGFVLGLIDDRPHRIDVMTPHRTGNGDVAVRRAVKLAAGDRRTVSGFPVTSPARTLVDLAATLPDRALARAVDRALIKGLATIAIVRTYIKDRQLQRKRGVGRLVKLLDDREYGVPESELERRTLELVTEYGLPPPTRQRRLGPHRVDFAYDTERVLIEVDGRATHGTSEAFEADPVRQNELVLHGWTVIRFTWRHVTQEPDYVANTIRRVLHEPVVG